jgi:transcriptional regulator with XRE-family HTH domain
MKPELDDLSQGSRIAFARQFRFMTQDNVSDKLGLTGVCKRRTMTRYEKGDRNPKDERTMEIAKILNVSYEAIKKYDMKDPLDLFYILMWLEEYIPNYQIDISKVPNIKEEHIIKFKKFINEWEQMREKRKKREISYEEYMEWKLTYEVIAHE